MVKLGILVTTSLCTFSFCFAGSNSQTFSYQGRFMNAAGTAPLKDLVDLKFSIYDPSAGCLLYQEIQNNIDLTATSGVFSTQVGSIVGSTKRSSSDPALNMGQIFANGSQVIRAPGTNCSLGYTPVSGDSRVLRVTVTPHSTSVATTLSPDLAINSVPQAQTADLIQGLAPADFVQAASGIAGQNNVSLSTLISLTGGGDASTLHNHDGRYIRAGSGSTYANLGAGAYTNGYFGIGVAAPTGNLGFAGNTGTQVIEVERNPTANATGNSLALSAGGATSGASNKAGGSLVLASGTSTGAAGSAISFQTSTAGSSGSTDNAPSTKMTLTSEGKLGLGTLTPSAELEVDASSVSTVGAVVKGFAAQVADLFQAQDSTGLVVAKIAKDGAVTIAGPLTLPGNPTSALQATTKQYVDAAVSASAAGVSTFNTRTGAVVLSSSDVTAALNYSPLKNTTDTLTGILTITGALGVGGAVGVSTQLQSTATAANAVGLVIKGAASQSADLLEFQNSSGTVLSKVDAVGMVSLAANPTSTLHAATKAYVDNAISSLQSSGNYITALTGDVTATGPSSVTATVASVGGSTAALVHSAEISANAATNLNTAGTLVKRDNSGNFAAGTVTGSLTGAASLNVLKAGDTVTGTLINAPATDSVAMILKNSSSQTHDLMQLQNNAGTVLAKFDSNGTLTLPANPTANLQATTKQYVDAAIAASSNGVATFNTRTGAVVLSSSDVSTALTYTPLKNTTDNLTGNLTVSGIMSAGGAAGSNTQFQSTPTLATNVGVVIRGAGSQSADLFEAQNSSGTILTKIDSSGMLTLPGAPTANLQAATKAYVDNAISSFQPSGNYITALTGDVTASGPSSATATVASVGGSTSALVHSAELLANAGTNANMASTLIKRDASGNFSAGTITGSLSGAASLNVLKTGDTITGTLTNAPSTDVVALILKNSSSQTNDLLQFKNNAGTVLSKFDSTGMLLLPANPTSSLQAATKSYVDTAVSALTTNWAAPGTIGSTTPNTGAFTSLSVISAVATTPVLTLKGVSGQSSDLLDVQTNTGTNVLVINSAGALTTNNKITAGRSIASTNSSTVNSASGTSLAVDMSLANVQIFSYNSADGGTDPGTNTVTVSLSNMISGGSYTLIFDNSANSSTPTFVLSGCTGKYVPTNSATTTSSQTIYSILYVVRGGTGYCYTSWITGF